MADEVDNPWNAASGEEQNKAPEENKVESKPKHQKPASRIKKKPKAETKTEPKTETKPENTQVKHTQHIQQKNKVETKTEHKISKVEHKVNKAESKTNKTENRVMPEVHKSSKSKMLPYILGGFLILVVVLGIYAYVNRTTTMYASVDGQKITNDDVLKRAKLYYSNEAVVTPTTEIVRQLVNEKLLLSEAKKAGITVPQEQIDLFIEQLKTEYAENYALELQKQGMTESEIKAFYTDQAKISKLLEGALPEMSQVSDDEVRAYYDANVNKFYYNEKAHALHLLYNTSEEANITYDRITKEGKTFEELSNTSIDQTYDLGYFKKGVMVKPFEDFVFNASVNQIGVVQTQFGWHVVKVVDVLTNGTDSFEEVKNSITSYLTAQKKNNAMTAYFNKIFSEHEVVFKETSCLDYFAIKNNSVLAITSKDCTECRDNFNLLSTRLMFFDSENYAKLVNVNMDENSLVLTTCYDGVTFANETLYICTSNNQATKTTNTTALEEFVKAC